MNLDILGAIKSAISSFEAAGTLGAILSLRWAPGTTWWERLTTFGSGIGMAFFIGPYLMERLEVKSANGLMAAGFMLGILGAHLIAKCVAGARKLDLQKLIEMLQLLKGK